MTLVLVVACAAAARPAAAQQDTAYTELIVQLRIVRGPERVVEALGRDSVVYLPLRQLLEMAEIRVHELVPGRRLAGTLEPGAIPFWFDTELATRGRRGATGAMAPGEAVWRGEELYLAGPVFATVFNVGLRMDWSELTAVVSDAENLPVLRRLERERRRLSLAAEARRFTDASLISVPAPLADGAALDWSAVMGSSDPEHNYSVQGGLGVALAGGSLELLAQRQVSSGLRVSHTRTSWERAWPERRDIRQLRLGDGFLDGPRPRATRGVAITNAPFVRPAEFMVDAVGGVLSPGWTLELFSGGRMLSYAVTDSAGRYQLPVPLNYGPNPSEVRAYGPNGEIVRRARAFEIPYAQLPRGRFEYALGAGECQADPCRHVFVGDARYGVSRRLTARGGVEAFRRAGRSSTWHPYASLAAALTPSLLVSGEAVVRAFRQGRLIYSPSPDLRVEAGHAVFDSTDARVLFGVSVDRRRSDLTTFWRPWGGRIQLTVAATRGGGAASRRAATSAGAQVRLPGATLSVTAHEEAFRFGAAAQTRSSGLDGGVFTLVPGVVPLLARSLVTAGVRTRCEGSLGACDPMPQEYRAALGRQLTPAVRLEAVATWQRLPRRTVLELNLTTNLPFVRAVTRSGYSRETDYQGSQQLEGSVLLNRRARRVLFGDGRSVGRGGVAGAVFLDRNGNGVQDGGEAGVPEVLVRVGSRGAVTDSMGRFASFDLLPFERAIVQLDTNSLTDPTWIPAVVAVAVRPTPNGYQYVPLPLVEGRELSGIVTLEGAGVGQVRVLARNVETNRVLTLTTYGDGTFYAPGVRPGTYELTFPREDLARMQTFFAPLTVTIGAQDRAPAPIRIDLRR